MILGNVFEINSLNSRDDETYVPLDRDHKSDASTDGSSNESETLDDIILEEAELINEDQPDNHNLDQVISLSHLQFDVSGRKMI